MNYTKFIGLLVGATCTLTANAAVHINEIMVRNSSAIINEDYNFEGWVELYNSGNEAVDLSNCYFTDTDDNTTKWQNKATTTIAAKGYAIFYFDEADKDNHASFKLDCDGGKLILTDASGNELDRITYPKTFRNTAYGRTTDGGDTFGHLLTATQGASNTSSVVKSQTGAPTFSQNGGFFNSSVSISISATDPAATIYYTTDGSEPKATTGTKYASAINISKTTVLRAIAVVDGEISSDITTSTYFVGNTVPVSTKVVSISSDNDYLYGDKLGALVVGTNGSTVPTNCASSDTKANYMNDWSRPCNVEIFDEGNVQRISQEVKFSAFGACSRTKPIKSIAIKANKVYGTNKLDYALFHEKPNLKWKSFVVRNSGNDFGRMLFRDGYLQTLASGLDIDHQAYEPVTVFVNGKYYGMMGLRERSNKDFIYSNYGLDEDQICIESTPEEATECDSYNEVLELANNTSATFADINKVIDVNEMLNYFSTEMYYGNQDWSAGNIKAWKRLEDGKWRWILYDTEFSTSLYGDYLNTDCFTYAAKCEFFPLFLNNTEIKRRLMTKFTAHAGTTFAEDHVSAVMDSMIDNVHDEADYYFNYLVSNKENEASSWRAECEKVRNFITARPDFLFSKISSNLSVGDPLPIRIYSDTKGANYDLNGYENINKTDFRSFYYKGETFDVKANAPDGYKFKEWQIGKEKYLLPAGSTWKYLYQSTSADATWKNADFNDGSWKEGAAPLGTGLSYFITTNISGSSSSTGGWGGFGGFGGMGGWGGFGTTVNTTTYLRNTFTVDDLSAAGDLLCTIKANDGAVVYINGKEAYRFNIDENEQNTDTAKAVLEMDSYATRQFSVSKDLLTEGTNVIAVELHNASGSSSIAFDMSVQDSKNDMEVVSTSTTEDYTGTLADSLAMKAVFEEDPDWTEDSLKLYINEVCVANKQYVDEYREDDDWIEIYNDGTTAVDLGGMYITDNSNLLRYEIPTGYEEETTVPAKGYLIIWADGDSTQGALHTNFQLDKKKNETVTLSRILDGEIDVIDSIRYESHTKGNSYARFSYVGDGAWTLTSVPTFDALNVYAPDHSTTILSDVELAQANGFDVRVYPNPVDDYLWFAFNDADRADITIIDYTGRQIKRSTINNGGSIYVGDLKQSVYVVSIQTGNRVLTTKFVKR